MKSPLILLLALLSFSCSSVQRMSPAENKVVAQKYGQSTAAEPVKTGSFSDQNDNASLTRLDKSGETEAADRKIIRNAEITIEVPSTTDAQHQVTSIAETHGGFIVTSEAKQRESSDPAQRTLDIKLVVRVPSNQFGRAFDEIKKLAGNTPSENVTSQDVTEDFIDLEARIKTQKALEVQFLEIMRQANKISDALEVQRQIAEVRTDI